VFLAAQTRAGRQLIAGMIGSPQSFDTWSHHAGCMEKRAVI